MKPQAEIACPICGNHSENVLPLPNWGEMRKCTDCGLFFADPMTLPMTSEELYTKAYNGEMGVTDAPLRYQDMAQEDSTPVGCYAETASQIKTQP